MNLPFMDGSGCACLLVLLAAAQAWSSVRADSLTIRADQPGVSIGPALYGLMTEEINDSYQGGLYAELIQNRDFKDNSGPTTGHWSLVTDPGADGKMTLDGDNPVNTVALTTSLRLDARAAGNGRRVGIANDGYWGIPVWPNTTYRVSFYARAVGGFDGAITVGIESAHGISTYAQAQVDGIGSEWRHFTTTITTGEVPTSEDNRFVVSVTRPGTLWLSLVSLFPPTYHNRPNGTRVDLIEKMAAMHPAFLRFPGGNYLEGNRMAEHFDWKKTIGDISLRPGHPSPWGYHSTDGFGLLEFLEWCEDLRMEPVLAVFAGYALDHEHVTGEALNPYVQDTLDEIEYVTGDVNTEWGAERARDGHPAPFKLRYVEVGNEDGFDDSGSYDNRFTRFHDAIKAKYPNLELISTVGGKDWLGSRFQVKHSTPDLFDEHYYVPWPQFLKDSHHYDHYDRNGPKIFVGEWASQDIPPAGPTPSMASALGDAAWMIGMERNADAVAMQCYAPLLVNVNPGGKQWNINLIGYDVLSSFGSPSYYAFSMFAGNRGDTVLPVSLTLDASSKASQPHGGIGVGTWNTQAEYKDIEVTSGPTILYRSNFDTGAAGWVLHRGEWGAVDGALRQTEDGENRHATIGSPVWGDYTITLKARKLGGSEGFLIRFHENDEANFIQLNLGGWGNQFHGLEKVMDGSKTDLGRRIEGHIDANRWYDVRIELQGTDIRCYLDGNLILEANDTAATAEPLITTASRDTATGDIILKAVNPTADPERFAINVQGVPGLTAGSGQVLTGGMTDVNTLDQPQKVAPARFAVKTASPGFMQEFPAHSITVLRLKTR
jgi:alpha-N-arabinofuranosidase